MAKHAGSPKSNDIDELLSALLSCGTVLSQVIGCMVEFETAGRSAPHAAPIPTVAHFLIRSVLGDVKHHHSSRDLKTATTIVGEVTDAICGIVDQNGVGDSGIDGQTDDPRE